LWLLDYQFAVTAGAYLSIVTDAITGQSFLKATDWVIAVNSLNVDGNGNATKPAGERIGLTSADATCESELADLREKITDLFDFGANYALSKLSSSVVGSLPLPPITNLINSVDLYYDALVIADNTVSVSAWARPTESFLNRTSLLESAVTALNKTFDRTVIQRIASEAPSNPQGIRTWMKANIPRYADLLKKRNIVLKHVRRQRIAKKMGSDKASMIRLSTDGAIFNIIAKKYLQYHKAAEKTILSVDASVLGFGASASVGVGFDVTLSGASGGIDNSGAIYMRCDVDISAWGDAQVTLQSPCGDDPLPPVKIGVGLTGPMQGNLILDTTNSNVDNQNIGLLGIKGSFSHFPGLYIIGLPDPIAGILNKVIEAATSFLFEELLNSVLDNIKIYIVSIPVRIPGTAVSIDLQNFSVKTTDGNLALSIQPKFEKA
jgi:hypothetical protein